MTTLLRFDGAVPHDPAVDAWLASRPEPLRAIARHWFALIRASGSDVRELMHDGFATACLDDAPFAYVGVFSAHVNVGFFQGATLADPAGLLQGTGRFMRHVKVRPGTPLDAAALGELITRARADMQDRLRAPAR